MPWAPRGATGVAHATLVELALAGAAGASRPEPPPEAHGSRSGRRRRSSSARSASPGASSPTGSRRAGRRTTTARSGRSTGARPSSCSSGGAALVGPAGALPASRGQRAAVRRLLPGSDAAARDRSRPAAAAGRHHAADDPDRLRASRRLGWTRSCAGQLPSRSSRRSRCRRSSSCSRSRSATGAIGIGDLKLLVSVGLLSGLQRDGARASSRAAAVGRRDRRRCWRRAGSR